jgi:predicted lipoprotein
MNKMVRYGVFLLVVAFLAYHSVYFKKLDEVKAGTASFNAKKYAADFWAKKLTPALARSTDTGQLLSLLRTDKDKAFKEHAHALGIGNIKYFLIKGSGKVTEVQENQVLIRLESENEKPEMRLATEYVFGNAVRDASGTIDINEFSNSMDFNNVSAEINKIIREKVIPPFKSKVKKGDVIEFAGAIELNQEYLKRKNIEIIPISLTIKEL